MATKRKLTRFSDLSQEHQNEVVGHLGRAAARKTLWRFEPRLSVDQAAAIAWDVSVIVHDSRVENVMAALKAGGKIRPILIDDLDEDLNTSWMEGIHRSLAAKELGFKAIPAFVRVE